MPLNWLEISAMHVAAPRTYNSMTKLVMAFADTASSIGKKTLFGKDKGLIQYRKMLERLRETILALTLDGYIQHSTPSETVVDALKMAVDAFAMRHPNWQDAYQFAQYMLVSDRENTAVLVERLRS